MRKPLIIGNWKMNGQLAESTELVRQLVVLLSDMRGIDVVVCPPFTALSEVQGVIKNTTVMCGAQNAHYAEKGAYTGEVSMAMLQELGCKYVLLGHSERRQYNGETDDLIAQKLLAAVQHGLTPVLCVGESLALREAGQGECFVLNQVARGLALLPQGHDDFVVAYEPIWAIGTGRAASPADANTMLSAIRLWLTTTLGPNYAQARLLYGGSVTPDNMADFAAQPDLDGALVGGASLKAATFASIVDLTYRGRVHV